MNSELFDIIIPSVFFFIAFFLAYSLIEAMIILFLNRLLFHYWGFTVEKLEQSQQLYRKKVKTLTLFAILVLIGALLSFTRFIEILSAATLEIKVLALETLLAMILIYLTTTRKFTTLAVEKTIHKYLYIYLSIIVFTFTIIVADGSYERYKTFINANITAIVKGVERKLEKNYKNDLLAEFRQKIYKGECREIDYVQESEKASAKHFVYVSASDDLRRVKTSLEAMNDDEKYFRGRACTNGVETFLLTDHGQWYWVLDS